MEEWRRGASCETAQRAGCLYRKRKRTGALFRVFAGIAVFISCLGLFGLMTYTAQLKTREIGVRKVLGATVVSVTALLAKEFIALVLLAILIASPVGWYFMNRWLEDFAYRTAISWWVFPVAGMVVFFIAVCTIGFQAVKVAVASDQESADGVGDGGRRGCRGCRGAL